jgi:hypothetical protein
VSQPARVAATGPLLSDDAWPIGCQVGFLERPFSDALRATQSWLRERRDKWRETRVDGPLSGQLLRLAPLQMPPGRELLVETAGGWTMHADNSRSGGDSVSWVGYLSGVLKCRGVIASHVPPNQYLFPSTQFELLGPNGPPPLSCVRTISAGIYDEGRRRFLVTGAASALREFGRLLFKADPGSL